MLRPITFLLLSPALILALPAHAATFSGTVLGPDSKPTANARVVLSDYSDFYLSNAKPAPSATSDAAGKWKIEVEDPKPQAGKAARPPLRLLLVHARGFAIAQALASDKAVEIKLQKGVSASGLVLDGAGKPVADVPVRLLDVTKPRQGDFDVYSFDILRSLSVVEPLTSAFTARTGADGRWSLDDLPAQTEAHFEIRDARWALVRAKAKLGAEGSADAAQAENMTARAAAVLTGRVVGEDGKPVARARVSASVERGSLGASVETGADGTFRLESLAAGTYKVRATEKIHDGSEGSWEVSWVAESLPEAVAVSGREEKLPDIVAAKGALVTGVVTDEETGAPLAQASVYNHDVRGDFYDVSQSDSKGVYRLRVLPGKAKVYIAGLPTGYLSPQTGNSSEQISLSLSANEEKKLDWKLRRGLDAEGLALGEDRQAVAGARLKLSAKGPDEDDWMGRHQSLTGAKGEWKIAGLKPGPYTIEGDDKWEVVSPKEIALPHKGALQVLVRPLASQALEVRAVTPEGKPIEQVALKFSVLVPSGANRWLGNSQDGQTDAAGKYSLGKLRPNYQVSLQATRAGYKYLRGGKAAYKDGAWTSEDVVMTPLLGRAVGRIVDAKGQPVQGAKVFSPEAAGSQATSDAEGRFALDALPEGEITLVATGAMGTAAKAARAGGAELSLALRPQQRLVAPDRDTAYAILEDVWETSRGSKWRARATLAAEYGADDLDQALKLALAAGEDRDTGASLGVQTLVARLIQDSPALAIEWAPAHLAHIQGPFQRLKATVELGLAASKIKPALAAQLYAQAKTIMGEVAVADNAVLANAHLAALAARLGLAEAETLADKALLGAGAGNRISEVALTLALGSAALAERAIEQLRAKPQGGAAAVGAATDSGSRELVSAYAYAIENVAPHDPEGALALLDKLEKVQGNQTRYTFAQATLSVIKALGPKNPASALTVARRVEEFQKPQALALAARFAPKAQALVLLREASRAVSPHWYNGPGTLARLAAQAHDLDAAAGTEMFSSALEKLQLKLAEDSGSWRQAGGARQVAEFDFFYSRIDPNASRVLLEQEWAFQRAVPTEARRGSSLDDLAVAMAALDAPRAQEMAWQSGGGDDLSAQFEAQMRIARLLLDPKVEESKLFAER